MKNPSGPSGPTPRNDPNNQIFMPNPNSIILGAALLLAGLGTTIHASPDSSHAAPLTLYYPQPAKVWTEALPLGNGRLGAMVFGGVERERLQLNEDTLWAGGPYDPANTNALAALPEVRQLIFEGKYNEADKLISKTMMGIPMSQMPYQTVGDLFLDFPSADSPANYRR